MAFIRVGNGDPNLVAENILNGVSIFGIVGTVRKFAQKTGSSSFGSSHTYTGNNSSGAAASFSLPTQHNTLDFYPMCINAGGWPGRHLCTQGFRGGRTDTMNSGSDHYYISSGAFYSSEVYIPMASSPGSAIAYSIVGYY